MSEFTATTAEFVMSACKENLAAITESLTLNLESKAQFQCGESQPWNAENIPAAYDAPGVIVVLEVGGRGIACLIPAALPLPEWYQSPTDTQSACLQTVGMEWGLSMLPEDLDAQRAETVTVENLRASLIDASPADDALMIELQLATESETDSDAAEPVAGILVIAAVDNLPKLPDEEPEPEPEAAPITTAASTASPSIPVGGVNRLNRLLPMPVQVSVRLAEKKIEMGHLIKLTPGMLIKFSKSCDSLLDLYVNGQHYGRGEAVKIGESFGIKIRDIGIIEPRMERVFLE